MNTFLSRPDPFTGLMSSTSSPAPLRAYRRAGKLVLEIDEHRFCADAFLQSSARILDRHAFLGYVCDHLFDLAHDDDADDVECQPTWWLRFSQALGEDAASSGAGVRRNDGTDDRLPIDQSPELFPDEITRELLGRHSKETPAA
jgi:hypothetical protein